MDTSVMRSVLVLRSPSHGTGWEERWSFRGNDERVLRDRLAELDAFQVEPPLETWDLKRGHVIEGDRWAAAMLLWPDEAARRVFPSPAECAWTAEGAVRLAESLPETFGNLRAAIYARFSKDA
jgi:hypothetical protein